MKNKNIEITIKLIISIVFIILTILTSFNIGRKFYELKNTFINNTKKVNISLNIAKFNFDINFIVENEVIEIE